MKGLVDTKAFVLGKLQQEMGELSKAIHELEGAKKRAVQRAEGLEASARAERDHAGAILSQICEKKADYENFRRELRRQQTMAAGES